jgi:BMFP domain-containing protein YqiC
MTDPLADADLTPLDLLARQNAAIESLTRTVELQQQQQLEALRDRIEALEGVPWPSRESPGSH